MAKQIAQGRGGEAVPENKQLDEKTQDTVFLRACPRSLLPQDGAGLISLQAVSEERLTKCTK